MTIDYQVHDTAIVEEGAIIGAGTRIWHHGHVRAGAVIGAGCNLGKNVFVDSGAIVGDRTKIQNNVSVYNGVVIGDEVFVGPAAVFTNDGVPRAAGHQWEVVPTTVERGASIGANATIVCGVTVGHHAMIGAGSVVIRDVPPWALVVGNPARIVGWVCDCGHRLGSKPTRQSPQRCGRCGCEIGGQQ